MSLTAYESRTLPSVFSDVHSGREVQAAKEEVQKARRAVGRVWIYVLVFIGALIAVGIFAGWAYNKYVAEHERAERLAAAVTQGDTLQSDYADLTSRRDRLAAARADLSQRIEVIARSNGTLAQELRTLAGKTWTDEDARLAAIDRVPPTYPRLQLEPESQLWTEVQRGGVATLDREARVMQVVIAAVQRRIDVAVPGGTPGGAICNPVTGTNCPTRVCNPVTGENCRRSN